MSSLAECVAQWAGATWNGTPRRAAAAAAAAVAIPRGTRGDVQYMGDAYGLNLGAKFSLTSLIVRSLNFH